jgi:hypothetical protein
MNLPKTSRPGPSIEQLRTYGVPALDNPSDAEQSFAALLESIMLGAGVNFMVQVFDCESINGITESDSGTFDVAAAAAAGKRVGTNCLKLVNTAATDGSQYVRLAYINESAQIPKAGGRKNMNWNDTKYIGFWNHTANAGDYNVAGDMKIALEYDGGQVSDKQNVPATVATAHQWVEFALSAFNCPLDKVEAIRFYSENADVGDYVQYDDIIRYLISDGAGPAYGACFPIKSGTTLVDNNLAKWTIDGLITGAADPETLGAVKLKAASVLGDAKRANWGQFTGAVRLGIARLNAAVTVGDALEWVSGTSKALLTDVTGAATENGVCYALETGAEQGDDIFVVWVAVPAAD